MIDAWGACAATNKNSIRCRMERLDAVNRESSATSPAHQKVNGPLSGRKLPSTDFCRTIITTLSAAESAITQAGLWLSKWNQLVLTVWQVDNQLDAFRDFPFVRNDRLVICMHFTCR